MKACSFFGGSVKACSFFLFFWGRPAGGRQRGKKKWRAFPLGAPRRGQRLFLRFFGEVSERQTIFVFLWVRPAGGRRRGKKKMASISFGAPPKGAEKPIERNLSRVRGVPNGLFHPGVRVSGVPRLPPGRGPKARRSWRSWTDGPRRSWTGGRLLEYVPGGAGEKERKYQEDQAVRQGTVVTKSVALTNR